jgi:adenylate cyclase
VDHSGTDGGGLTATALSCGSCGAVFSPTAKFCSECGTPVTQATQPAEYKQVTVLFADVVHSMDIAAAVGTERLREIMADLTDRCAAVVQRFGGTVDKFTGDGIMAVFGAPLALEDHAVRACLAALGIQEDVKRLAVEVHARDGVNLQLRVGLNSGQVIAGEIGSGALGYTAVGEQVGMAQRMESVAPPGGVMLSESTVRLVANIAVLGDPEMARIKGSDAPVPARRLLGVTGQHELTGSARTVLVGRDLEVTTLGGLLDRSAGGRGSVVCVAGPAGIGKTRLVSEAVRLAIGRDVEVFSTFCESHTSDVAFHVVAPLLRDAAGITDLGDEAARARVRAQNADAGDEDLLLLYDLLGIGDPEVALPTIDPDARRRRLTAMINSASLARTAPALYIIEDAHWIDEVSESMFAGILTVIPQTHSTMLITYRPEYRGPLAHLPGAQTISLAPLSDSETSALLGGLLGPDPSVAAIKALIGGRAAGNPFFAQEMVRELAERGVLQGERGRYTCVADVAEVSVPATLQAAIAARIDRLAPNAKQTINAAAVVGSRFTPELLTSLGTDLELDELVKAELIDQVRFTARAEYAFRHPLIRTVAYESPLKSSRAHLHRLFANAIQASDPQSVDENAALIAEHLEAAGDLPAAYDWHMRAGTWLTSRNIAGAQTSWRRAREVADRLPDDAPDRASMRIAPRTLLCGSAWRVGGSGADTGFDDLRDLCTAAGDQRSLAIGMTGQVAARLTNAHRREASGLATEQIRLLESIGDPTLTIGQSFAALLAKHETGEMAEVLRLAQRVIDLAGGDPTAGNVILGSPLAVAIGYRGEARWCFGIPGWMDDFAQAIVMAHAADPISLAAVILYTYYLAIPGGALLPDATALRDTADALAIAERSSDEMALHRARFARGIVLAHRDGLERERGWELLAQVREAAVQERYSLTAVPIVDIQLAQQKATLGDLDGAIELTRAVLEDLFASGGIVWTGLATTVLVEALLHRGGDGDLQDAQTATDRLAAVPTDPGFVLNEISLRLRALLARAHGDKGAYRDYRDRYRVMATSLGFEGHIAWAESMP